MSMAMGMGMGMNQAAHNVPFPGAVGPMGLQGQWGASAAASFGDQFGNLSMPNFLNAGAGLVGGMGAGMVDPRALAVHHHAMMIAKQTYQLAVAQQAMRDAGDEWERGSAVSGWTGGRSSVGAPSMLGMGMNTNTNMNMNMGGGGGGGGGGMSGFPGLAGSFAMPGAGGMWPGGTAMPGYPGNPAPGPMYTNNFYAASEIGGRGGGDRGGSAGWATSSVYGEAFGAPRDRTSRAFRQNQVGGGGGGGGNGGSAAGPATTGILKHGGRPRTRTAPSGLSLNASAGAGAGTGTSGTPPRSGGAAAGVKKRTEGYGLVGAVSPPSSWKSPA
jgi:hypothetical protein